MPRFLRKNMRGPDVKKWQLFLIGKGYTEVGAADGVFGDDTGAAYDCTWRTENERPLIPPENDDFANARPMSALHESAYGDTYLATLEAGEPAHAGGVGGRSVWFTFTAPSSGEFSISTQGALDTLLAVYRGNRVDQLALVAENDDAQGGLTSQAQFRATANETLAVAVDAGIAHDDQAAQHLGRRDRLAARASAYFNGVEGPGRFHVLFLFYAPANVKNHT